MSTPDITETIDRRRRKRVGSITAGEGGTGHKVAQGSNAFVDSVVGVAPMRRR
jgi:hypothetical protein